MAEIGKYRAKRIDTGETVEGYGYTDKYIDADGTEHSEAFIQTDTVRFCHYENDNSGELTTGACIVDPSTIERVEDGCEFCSYRDFGDTPFYPRKDNGYSFYAGYYMQYDVDEFDEREIDEINFCPMCGKQLKEVEGK